MEGIDEQETDDNTIYMYMVYQKNDTFIKYFLRILGRNFTSNIYPERLIISECSEFYPHLIWIPTLQILQNTSDAYIEHMQNAFDVFKCNIF